MSPALAASAALAVLTLAALGGLAEAQPTAGPPAYSPPPDTAKLLDGPDLAQAQRHCLACHSADYVTTQPRGMPEAFWASEVAKMRTAYGAVMTDEDAAAVSKYLSATYRSAAPAR
jgi:mono/diheme cytochrome c family protein